ncbi:hypothetical protein EYF80_032775 [Liparis tanakae]|uniref:Uncharacterized protein n=1 Tax=Liparis tanakae TaxID=230148 RepID=A0A4Z2GV38_9TELE|nr:hypothetical protein EYF80_032775 [Liparis tanakae]
MASSLSDSLLLSNISLRSSFLRTENNVTYDVSGHTERRRTPLIRSRRSARGAVNAPYHRVTYARGAQTRQQELDGTPTVHPIKERGTSRGQREIFSVSCKFSAEIIAVLMAPAASERIEKPTSISSAVSPKAAPALLEEFGVLSRPASRAASAPPWSLYKATVDMSAFKLKCP